MKNTRNYFQIIDEHVSANLTTEDILNTPFFEILTKCENDFGIDINQWDEELINYLHLKRINQLWKIAQKTDQYKNIKTHPNGFTTLEEYFSTVGYITRDDYRDYMLNNKLDFEKKKKSPDYFIESKSGGSTGKPVITYFTLPDADSVAITEVKNYINLFAEDKLHRFWDLSSDSKSATHKKFWDILNNENIQCYKGKIHDPNKLLNFLINYKPDVFRATAYSVIRQVNKFEELKKSNENLEVYLNNIRAYIFGGEFLPEEAMERIKTILPNAVAISRYGTSQGLGALGYSRLKHRKLHVLNNNLCHLHLIDEDLQPITKPGVEGEVVITHLHNSCIPILNTRMYDRASYVLSDSGKKLLQLHGRTDSIMILNTQKIDVIPLIDYGTKLLKNMDINANGIGQIIKTHYTKVEFVFEVTDITINIILSDKKLELFFSYISSEIKRVAGLSGLPEARAVENLEVKCTLVPEGKIPRFGERKKVRIFEDKTAN